MIKKTIAIIAGEPNSISSEIIFKSWKQKNRFKHKPFFIIGSVETLKKQAKKLKFNFKIKKINHNFTIKNLLGNELPVYDIHYKQKKTFQNISNKSNKYIFDCFNCAIKLVKKKRIFGFINCPISKENLLGNKYSGITEFISKKFQREGNEVMLIFNNKLAVSPVTTHIPLRKVNKFLTKKNIIKKAKIINDFYQKKLGYKPSMGILGLNPHNFSGEHISEEKRIIIPAIKELKANKFRVSGPISTDTSFLFKDKLNLDVIIGMYHDQVLTTFKTLYGFNAINITLGLPFYRISPDHGVGEKIMGKNKANPLSLIESIKFFNLLI